MKNTTKALLPLVGSNVKVTFNNGVCDFGTLGYRKDHKYGSHFFIWDITEERVPGEKPDPDFLIPGAIFFSFREIKGVCIQ